MPSPPSVGVNSVRDDLDGSFLGTVHFDNGSVASGDGCSTNAYCAYHSAFLQGGVVIYADMPYVDLNSCGDPYNGPQVPNGNSYADTEIGGISHEASESITDFTGAWLDA